MAKPELFETSKVGGIVLMVAGVIFMLLTFLDYLQDGKTDGEIVAMNLLIYRCKRALVHNRQEVEGARRVKQKKHSKPPS